MLSRLLLVGVLSGASVGGLVGQAAPAPLDWGSLAGSAIGSSPAAIILAWQLTKADKRDAKKDLIIREKDEVIERLHGENRAMAERMGSALTESTRTIAQATEGLEATLNRNRPQDDLNRVIRELKQVIRDEGRDRRGGPR